jgi:hypothetical protein
MALPVAAVSLITVATAHTFVLTVSHDLSVCQPLLMRPWPPWFLEDRRFKRLQLRRARRREISAPRPMTAGKKIQRRAAPSGSYRETATPIRGPAAALPISFSRANPRHCVIAACVEQLKHIDPSGRIHLPDHPASF